VKIGKLKKDPAPYSGIRTSATFLNASRWRTWAPPQASALPALLVRR